jgi:hypothetical protein
LAAVIVLTALGAAGCAHDSINGASTTAATQPISIADELHVVRGGVQGLDAVGLVLENNGTDAIALSKDGLFVFARALASGAAYAVTVAQQPDGETCMVRGGAGTIASSDVTDIGVLCSPNAITLEGAVSGLRSSVLVSNGDDVISVAGSGRFFMPVKLGPAATYDVVVDAQPMDPRQVCIVQDGRGVTTEGDVIGIHIVCIDQ